MWCSPPTLVLQEPFYNVPCSSEARHSHHCLPDVGAGKPEFKLYCMELMESHCHPTLKMENFKLILPVPK